MTIQAEGAKTYGGRTAFVLSGGGSLGAVQVGMLQALGTAGIRPDFLIGTSAGAVNAVRVASHGMSAEQLVELGRLWGVMRRRDLFPIHPDQLLRALVGAAPAVSSSHRLGALVRAYAGIDRLEDADIEVHLVGTNLLTGKSALFSDGAVDTAVLASTAVPGIFPPVLIDGRHYVDGAVAHHSGIQHAVALGASTVWVLPTGYPCALPRPPHSALAVALHALTLLIEQRLITEIAAQPPEVSIRVLPPLCPLAVSPADFGHAVELIRRARIHSERWLDRGMHELPRQQRFLEFHEHEAAASTRRRVSTGRPARAG